MSYLNLGKTGHRKIRFESLLRRAPYNFNMSGQKKQASNLVKPHYVYFNMSGQKSRHQIQQNHIMFILICLAKKSSHLAKPHYVYFNNSGQKKQASNLANSTCTYVLTCAEENEKRSCVRHCTVPLELQGHGRPDRQKM